MQDKIKCMDSFFIEHVMILMKDFRCSGKIPENNLKCREILSNFTSL